MKIKSALILLSIILKISLSFGQGIHEAAIEGDLEKVKSMIGTNHQLINEKDSNGFTPLFHAASNGNSDIVKLLLENGAQLEANNNYKRTPLLLATREGGGIETVQVLVEAGANINAVDIFGDTPLSIAAWRGYEDIVNYLLSKDAYFSTTGEAGIKLLKYAVDKRLWNLYKSMIKKGGVEFLSELQRNPVLHWASAGGSAKIVNDLINFNFQINANDQYQWVPLHYASYFGRLEVAKLLIEKGAEINSKTPLGETPYYLAGLENKNEVIDFLKSVGADQATPRHIGIKGEFMGQSKPGNHLELFAPGIVSRLKGGHSNITFSPGGKMAFWTEWILKDVGYSSGCTIWYSKIIDGEWILPKKFLSKGDTPFFSTDGQKVYLMAKLPAPPTDEKYGIWFYEIEKDAITGPNYLDFDVPGTGLYWQYSFDKHENLYFGTDAGLFRSLKIDAKYSGAESLSEIFHPDYRGGSPYISPDGDYIIFSSMDLPDSYGSADLYIGYKFPDGTWSKPINMGPTVNSSAIENLAMVSPDGKYLFLRTERNGVSGIYWISAKIIDELKQNQVK